MSEMREPAFDRAVGLVLRIGAFSCFFLMLAGLMLATPVVRVIVACFLFFWEKDWKYGWISLGVLVILMLGSVFGLGEH